MPDFSAQVYWHMLPTPACPENCVLNTMDKEVLLRAVEAARIRDLRGAKAGAGGGQSQPVIEAEGLSGKWQRTLARREMQRQKRSRDLEEVGGDGSVEKFTPTTKGIHGTDELLPLTALNVMMNNLKCRKISIEELVVEVNAVLADVDTEPSVLGVLNNIFARRGLQALEVNQEELLEKKRTYRATNFALGKEALMILDTTRPLFTVAIPRHRVNASLGRSGENSSPGRDGEADLDESQEEATQGSCLQLMVPIPDPVAWIRVIATLTIPAKCLVLFIQKMAHPVRGDYSEFAPLSPEFKAPKNIADLMTERMGATGNPFNSIPILAQPTAGAKATSQRKKVTLVPWYLRFLSSDDLSKFKAHRFRKSQVELSVRDTQRSQRQLPSQIQGTHQVLANSLAAGDSSAGGLPDRPPTQIGLLETTPQRNLADLLAGATQMDEDPDDIFA